MSVTSCVSCTLIFFFFHFLPEISWFSIRFVVAKIGAGRPGALATRRQATLKAAALANTYLQKYTHEQLAYPLRVLFPFFLFSFVSFDYYSFCVPCNARERARGVSLRYTRILLLFRVRRVCSRFPFPLHCFFFFIYYYYSPLIALCIMCVVCAIRTIIWIIFFLFLVSHR